LFFLDYRANGGGKLLQKDNKSQTKTASHFRRP